jgi:hypothetical protein
VGWGSAVAVVPQVARAVQEEWEPVPAARVEWEAALAVRVGWEAAPAVWAEWEEPAGEARAAKVVPEAPAEGLS